MLPALEPQQERRILRELLQQLEDPPASWRRMQRQRRWLQAAGSLLMLTGFLLAFGELVQDFFSALLACMGGVLTGLACFIDSSLRQWPATIAHVDADSLRRRLAELDE